MTSENETKAAAEGGVPLSPEEEQVRALITRALMDAWLRHPGTKAGEWGKPENVYFSVQKAVDALGPVVAAELSRLRTAQETRQREQDEIRVYLLGKLSAEEHDKFAAERALAETQREATQRWAERNAAQAELAESRVLVDALKASLAETQQQLAEAERTRIAEVEHWVTRYNELEQWRIAQSKQLLKYEAQLTAKDAELAAARREIAHLERVLAKIRGE